GPGPRQRPARDAAAPVWLRPPQADVSRPGPRLPTHRCRREGRQEAAGVTAGARSTTPNHKQRCEHSRSVGRIATRACTTDGPRSRGGSRKERRMKVLVVGKGGREHALVWKLSQSPRAERVFCAPGNAGTAEDGVNVPIEANDIDRLLRFVKK